MKKLCALLFLAAALVGTGKLSNAAYASRASRALPALRTTAPRYFSTSKQAIKKPQGRFDSLKPKINFSTQSIPKASPSLSQRAAQFARKHYKTTATVGAGALGLGAAYYGLQPGAALAEETPLPTLEERKDKFQPGMHPYNHGDAKNSVDSVDLLSIPSWEKSQNAILDALYNYFDDNKVLMGIGEEDGKQYYHAFKPEITPKEVEELMSLYIKKVDLFHATTLGGEPIKEFVSMLPGLALEVAAEKLRYMDPEDRNELKDKVNSLEYKLKSIVPGMTLDTILTQQIKMAKTPDKRDELENLDKLLYPEKYSWTGWLWNKLGY